MNQPDRFYIEKRDRELYDRIEILSGRSRKEQFLFAMAFGFKNRARKKLENREGFFLAKDLGPDDISLINAVAMFVSGSVDVLEDGLRVAEIAEEYAHGGVIVLYDRVSHTSLESGSFEKQFERDLYDLWNSAHIDKNEESSSG